MSVEGLIKRARLEVGLTQLQLAQRLGVTHQTASLVERMANPSPAVLARYGAAMGYELVVFYRYVAGDGQHVRYVAADGPEIIIE